MSKKIEERKLQGRYRIMASGHRVDPKVLDRFDGLVADYDVYLSRNDAINKLIQWALKEWYIPGYERRDRPHVKTMEERENEKFGDATPVYDGDKPKSL